VLKTKILGPNAIDVHVGARLRLCRKSQGMSQGALASQLGMTFQQVQKYERGVNRISASVLFTIAQVLKVPVSHFFEGLPGQVSQHHGEAGPTPAFMMTPGAPELVSTFPRLPNARARHAVMTLVRALAAEEEVPA